MNSTLYCSVTAGALLLIGASAAAAQNAPAPAQPAAGSAAAAENDSTLMGEVLVTARKRTESVQDAPVAINAFNKKFIDTYKIANIQDLASFTPGLLSVEANTMGGNHVFLRGIGSQLDNALSEGSVAVDVDGVQVPGQIMRVSQIDMGQIEVLRGPQALFFGKNSPGGVMSFTSAAPTRTFSAGITTGYEFYASQKYVDAYVSGPITDTLTARLAGHYSDQLGPWKYESLAVPGESLKSPFSQGPHEHETALRGTLQWRPNDKFDVIARLTYFDMFQHGDVPIQRLNCTPGATPFIDPAFAAVEDCKINNTIVVAPNFPGPLASDPLTKNEKMGYVANTQYFLPVTANYRINHALTLTSVTGFFAGLESAGSNFSVEPAPIIYSDQVNRTLQMSEELRLLSSFNGPVNFLAGVYVESTQINYRQAILSSSGNTVTGIGPIVGGVQRPLVENAQQAGRAYSPFAQLIIKPVDTVEVDLGARYSYEEKSAAFRSNFFPGVEAGLRKSWTNWSPEATVRYKPTRDLNFYASYKQGFKSGGIEASAGQPTAVIANSFSPSPLFNDTFNQETDSGFEIGAKMSALDSRLHVNLAAFTYDYKGLQLSNFDPTTVAISIENIGGARTTGVELDFNWRPPGIDGLTLYGSADYLNARYTNYIGDCFAGQSIEQGCNLYFDTTTKKYLKTDGVAIQGEKQNLKGLVLKSAPDFTATLGADYETTVSNLMRLGLSVDMDFSSRYSADLADNPFIFQDAFVKVNAAIRFTSMNSRWQFAIIGRNLTDEYVIGEASKDFVANAAAQTGRPGGGPSDYFGNVLRGREVRMELSYKY